MNVYGNVEGIKRAVLWDIQGWDCDYERTDFIAPELLERIVKLSNTLKREICVFLSRTGRLLAVGIGNSTTVPLKELSTRRSKNSLCGVRCIHTHPECTGKLSDVDISALTSCRYDCMAAIGIRNGGMVDMEVAYITEGGIERLYSRGSKINHDDLLSRIGVAEKATRQSIAPTEQKRTILVHVSKRADAEESLDELDSLSRTMGYKPVGRILQRLPKPDRVSYLGSGKVDELRLAIQVNSADTIIIDEQITALQNKCLVELLPGVRILDRAGLILDIFAKHATTAEGKLQVELARLTHELPLLVGSNEGLDKGRGGLHAMAGSGETKTETDRRTIRQRIKHLREQLERLQQHRDDRRHSRKQSGMKSVVIVGYTNAGKSTLMNYITKAGVLEEDKLFATLDSVSRTVWDENKRYLLTDTVGFISQLPHEFVEAFKSTLDEARYADLLIHVVDGSNPHMMSQYDVVLRVLEEIGANAPIITVYNKCDKGSMEHLPTTLNSVTVSAKTGAGVSELRTLIRHNLFEEE